MNCQWLKSDFEHIKDLISFSRLPNSLIISGNNNIGKNYFSLNIASTYLDTEISSIDNCQDYTIIELEEGAKFIKVDQIRNLLNTIYLSSNKRVIYIKDADKLNESSSNCLLKILEEPPKHAIFILATTENQKLPETIVSRCQRYDFKIIPFDVVVTRLREICDSENAVVSEEALSLITRYASGSLRDAENLLEQAIVSFQTNLKEDQNAFLDQLTEFIWESHASDSARIEFTRTFSNTEGVTAQFDKEDKLSNLHSWGVASGVLKLGDSVYIEARITETYLIAMDSDDGFIVLRRGKPRQEIARTDLRVARELFLKELATGAWEKPRYSTTYTYRFRPLESDLRGLRFEESSKKLQSTEVWEYSVATGAMKIGYSEYIGGLLIGDVLVFVDDDGSQEIYHREPTIEKKHFTTVDTKTIPVSERTAFEVNDAIARQLSQEDTYFLFEFQSDGRTGYLHRWTSTPFQITGEGLKFSDGYTEHKKIYLIEDYIALGDEGFKIDTRTSRLRPKTDAEAVSDATEAEQNLKTLQEGGVKL